MLGLTGTKEKSASRATTESSTNFHPPATGRQASPTMQRVPEPSTAPP